MRVVGSGIDFRPNGVRHYRIIVNNLPVVRRLINWITGRPDYAEMINRHIDGVRDGLTSEDWSVHSVWNN